MVSDLTRFVGLIFYVLLLTGCMKPVSEGLQVKAIGNMERFAPFETVTGKNQVTIFAAHNEYEGFQLVITAGKLGAQDINIHFSALTNDAGESLDQIQIFRERYVQVTKSSPYSPYSPRAWADILLPVMANVSAGVSANNRAFPQQLSAGENLPVWIDVHVPKTAKSGVYSGTITVTSANEAVQELPVTLTVWDFVLPTRSPLYTVFGTNGFRVAEEYQFERTGDNAADNKIIRAYNDFLLAHYLSPESYWDAIPLPDANGHPDFSRYFAGLGTVTENMQHYMQDKHATVYTYAFADDIPLPEPLGRDALLAKTFMQDYAQWCQNLAGNARCYTNPSFLDEPSTAQDYQRVREWGAFFHSIPLENGQSIAFQVTEPPLNEDRATGNLFGAVDVWVPRFYDVWQDIDYLGRNVIKQRLQQGEAVWAYTALTPEFEDYRRIHPTADALRGNYPPVWQLDYPAMNYRIPTWLFHHYGITGLVYWETLASDKRSHVWQNAASFFAQDNTVFNGDGSLTYAGKAANIGFDIPVPSLRLKWIRESIEDYMYIDLLLKAGEKDFVQTQVSRLARNFGDWENNPELLMQIRQAMGERLSQLQQKKAMGNASR